MREVILILLLAWTCFVTANAEILHDWPKADYIKDVGYAYYDADLPDWLTNALSEWLKSEDRILGSIAVFLDPAEDEAASREVQVLVLAERDGRILLFAASRNEYEEDPGWLSGLETDQFLQSGDEFELLPLRTLNEQGGLFSVALGLRRNHQILALRVSSGKVYVEQCLTIGQDGDRLLMIWSHDGIGFSMSSFTAEPDVWDMISVWSGESIAQAMEQIICVCPDRLWAWETMKFPENADEVHNYSEAHQLLPLPENIVFIDANLRTQATGSSESLGFYTARAEVLDTQEGERWPWFHVQIGETQGYVAGLYVFAKEGACRAASQTLPVAEAAADNPLVGVDGRTICMVPAGSRMHVLAVRGDQVHVLLPSEGLAGLTDWEGTYGYLPMDVLRIANSPAELNWLRD